MHYDFLIIVQYFQLLLCSFVSRLGCTQLLKIFSTSLGSFMIDTLIAFFQEESGNFTLHLPFCFYQVMFLQSLYFVLNMSYHFQIKTAKLFFPNQYFERLKYNFVVQAESAQCIEHSNEPQHMNYQGVLLLYPHTPPRQVSRRHSHKVCSFLFIFIRCLLISCIQLHVLSQFHANFGCIKIFHIPHYLSKFCHEGQSNVTWLA